MDEKLEKELYEKYPKLFRQKDSSMKETCMCWGFECGNGWYWLLDNLCSCIQGYVDSNDRPQVEAVQVKEKFGTLRFYINNGDDYIYGMIFLAESLSYNVCENCGSTKNIIHTKGWVKTLCKNCANQGWRKND